MGTLVTYIDDCGFLNDNNSDNWGLNEHGSVGIHSWVETLEFSRKEKTLKYIDIVLYYCLVWSVVYLF